MLARCPRPPAWLVAVCFFSYVGCARSHFLGEPDAATEEPDGGRDTDPDAGPNTMQDASADHAFPMRDADVPDLGPWTAPGVTTPSGDVFCGPPTASDVRVDLVARGDQLWLLIASASGWSVHARSDAGYRLIASGEEPSVRRAAAAPRTDPRHRVRQSLPILPQADRHDRHHRHRVFHADSSPLRASSR